MALWPVECAGAAQGQGDKAKGSRARQTIARFPASVADFRRRTSPTYREHISDLTGTAILFNAHRHALDGSHDASAPTACQIRCVQEYTFSPHGSTYQREDLSFDFPKVSHLRLTIVPNKGGTGKASLTSLRLFS